MRFFSLCFLLGLLIAVLPVLAVADDNAETREQASVWLGGHYTSFSDNNRRVGEYHIGLDEAAPELKINYLSTGGSSILRFDGHVYDRRNLAGIVKLQSGDAFGFTVEHRSLIQQFGQDLLTNAETKEALGGKFLTHDVKDEGEDYNVRRREIISRASGLLAQKGNVKLSIHHRTILRNGTKQGLTTSHCFSCHLESQTVKVDDKSHAVEAEVQADVTEGLTVAYEAGFRSYKSEADPGVRQYDRARHPVNGGAAAEFGSRLQFDNTALPYGVLPHTEKVSNKVRVRGSFSSSTKMTASVGYNKSTNQNTDLSADTWYGHASLATTLSPKTRLVAKVTGRRVANDDPFIDVRDWREGRPADPNNPDFDFVRFSALDRRDINGTAELYHRLSPKLLLQVLGGVHWVDRVDYPVPGDGLTSTTLTGQAKLRFRPNRKLSGFVKYRLESTSDPYVASKGLFEARGRETLSRPWPGFGFVFYYAREGLRYQSITTEPTIAHEFEVNASLQPSAKANINFKLLAQLDKNTDLDSLDVEHTYFQPHLGINLLPNPKWTVSSGYSLNYSKSRGPIAVALFDG